MTDATPVQVVFQGGGAKICALMAVCALLREYEKDEIIKITRVAGSSAGAIAAVMCASSVTIDEFKAKLRLVAPRYLETMSSSKWFGYRRVIFGHPYFKNVTLEDVFRDIFCSEAGTPRHLRDLRIDTEIFSTNIYSLTAQQISRDEAIPIALAKSCRIPYFFSGFNSDDPEVDGGLALNLPVDRLKSDESTLGPVIGISFFSNFSDKSLSNLVRYTEQLFSAAIQSNVERSKTLLGEENVFSIDTKVGMLDFDEALGDGLDEKFRYVKLQFKSWFDNRLAALRPKTSTSIETSTPFVYPLLNSAPLAGAIVEELKDHYQAEKFTHALSSASYDTAILNADGDFSGKYRSRFRNRYRITKKTRILSYDFQTGKSDSVFSDLKLRVMAINEKAEPLKFTTHVQELSADGNELRSFRIYLLFDSALIPDSPDQPFTVECTYEVDDPFPKLGVDAESLSLTRVDGDADEVMIAAAFPRKKLRNNFQSSDLSTTTSDRLQAAGLSDARMVPSQALDPGAFISELGLTAEIKHYIFHVRQAKDVAQGQTIGVLIG